MKLHIDEYWAEFLLHKRPLSRTASVGWILAENMGGRCQKMHPMDFYLSK